MDIDALHSTLLTVSLASEKVRSLARELSEPVDLGEARRQLGEVESELRLALATLAGELGFRLCPRCWPPEILTIDREGEEHCSSCGQPVYNRAA